MCDPNNPNIQNRTTPQWSLHYSACNAGLSWTHLASRQAFYRHRIIPRTCVDTNQRDTATEIFGHRVDAPIGFAPIGINRIYHPAGELSVAKVAEELKLTYCLSSAGSYSIEEVGKANGDGPRFVQLYQSHDDDQAISMMQRALDNGFDVCMLMTDTWSLAWHHNDFFTGNYAFYHDHGAGDLGLKDPVFQQRLKEAGINEKQNPMEFGAKWIDKNIWYGRAHTWEKVKWTMAQWKRISGGRSFCIKCIQNVEDAKKCVELYEFDGILVTNHAGRQVDGAVASLDVLEKIADAIMFDSCVRSAADVFKALALGAKYVFISRLWVWALSISREHGVRHMLKSLLAEFDLLMEEAGYPFIDRIDGSAIDSLPQAANLIAEHSGI
ncbi:FMN-dependent dehydrogenase [Talaromyces proteolyticus]|uniref:FMN-dependent dehydrogenase n=1 Tax=Talaromyces proteolyticus TaxID=1131652 RepID=A0AAD4L049_9EURO|nr:FMN-dependent dehydrogenase [Talaromyces proteolyticus]KAH8705108.1 FMN-dependent dehydrogenase [Talaromyces proteolyticus]